MSIGPRVRERRKALRLSQEQLASQAGLTWSAIQRLEAGQVTDPHYSTLLNIAHVLGTTIADLVGEEPAVPKASAPPSETTTGADTAGETIVYLSGEGSEPARNTARELLSYFLAEGKLTVEDLEEASDALLSEASEASEAKQEKKATKR